MKELTKIIIATIALAAISTGCVRAISKELRAKVQEEVTVVYALENQTSSLEKVVMWGGVIVEAKNLEKGTLLEIVQKPTRSERRPKDVDESEGRFFAMYDGFLDVAIYEQGREVTVAGKLKEFRPGKIGEMEYMFPLVHAKEVYLWAKRKARGFYSPYWGTHWHRSYYYHRGPYYW